MARSGTIGYHLEVNSTLSCRGPGLKTHLQCQRSRPNDPSTSRKEYDILRRSLLKDHLPIPLTPRICLTFSSQKDPRDVLTHRTQSRQADPSF